MFGSVLRTYDQYIVIGGCYVEEIPCATGHNGNFIADGGRVCG